MTTRRQSEWLRRRAEIGHRADVRAVDGHRRATRGDLEAHAARDSLLAGLHANGAGSGLLRIPVGSVRRGIAVPRVAFRRVRVWSWIWVRIRIGVIRIPVAVVTVVIGVGDRKARPETEAQTHTRTKGIEGTIETGSDEASRAEPAGTDAHPDAPPDRAATPHRTAATVSTATLSRARGCADQRQRHDYDGRSKDPGEVHDSPHEL